MAAIGDDVLYREGENEYAAKVTAIHGIAPDNVVTLTAFHPDGSISGHKEVKHISAVRTIEGDDLSETETPHYRLAHEYGAR